MTESEPVPPDRENAETSDKVLCRKRSGRMQENYQAMQSTIRLLSERQSGLQHKGQDDHLYESEYRRQIHQRNQSGIWNCV